MTLSHRAAGLFRIAATVMPQGLRWTTARHRRGSSRHFFGCQYHLQRQNRDSHLHSKNDLQLGQKEFWDISSRRGHRRFDSTGDIDGDKKDDFIVDGNWVQDMLCSEMVPNPFGTLNSVIVVE